MADLFAAVILKKNDQFILLKRSLQKRIHPNLYCLVGGAVEANETFRQAAIRETFEEVGVTIQEQDLHFTHVFQKLYDGKEFVVCVFGTEVWTGEPFNKEPTKHTELIWVTMDSLPQDMVKTHRNVLYAIQRHESYSEQFV